MAATDHKLMLRRSTSVAVQGNTNNDASQSLGSSLQASLVWTEKGRETYSNHRKLASSQTPSEGKGSSKGLNDCLLHPLTDPSMVYSGNVGFQSAW